MTSMPPRATAEEQARHKPALAPPPPTMSLIPPNDPSIPPAPPLGFDAPSVPPRVGAAAPQRTSNGSAIALGVGAIIVLCAIGGGLYVASTGGTGTSRLGGPPPSPPPVPAPPVTAPPPPPADAGAATTTAEPSPSVAELLASADESLRDGDAEEALEGYRAVIALDVHDPYGHAGAARALLSLGRSTEAITFASRAVAHRQRRAAFRVLLGDAYEAHGEHERAVAEWRTALELEPDDREAASRLGE
jgi:hypothetical protein